MMLPTDYVLLHQKELLPGFIVGASIANGGSRRWLLSVHWHAMRLQEVCTCLKRFVEKRDCAVIIGGEFNRVETSHPDIFGEMLRTCSFHRPQGSTFEQGNVSSALECFLFSEVLTGSKVHLHSWRTMRMVRGPTMSTALDISQSE